MNFIEILETQWTFVSITAPAITWFAAFGVVVVSIAILTRLKWKVWRERQIYRNLTTELRNLSESIRLMPATGLSLDQYEKFFSVLEPYTNIIGPSISVFRSGIIAIDRSSREREYWSSMPASEAFSEESMSGYRINRSFYSAVPGVITGFGLLITFVAILVALLRVKLVETRVEGLELLIEGLSGKFISSIAALLMATIYIVFERRMFHPLVKSRQDLVTSIDSIVPQIRTNHLLQRVHAEMAEQSLAFRNFNTSLAPLLKQSFSESIGPTLERAATSIENLNVHLRAIEAQKSESLVNTIRPLIEGLQASISGSMESMVGSFSQSLTGSAKDQFNQVIQTLASTGTLVERMNGQFETSQASMQSLIAFAEKSTNEQLQIGKLQVQELTEVLTAMMKQLNETAGASVSNMASVLTSTVFDLSQKVDGLTSQMMEAANATTSTARGISNDLLVKAGEWTTKHNEQFESLLLKHQVQLDRVVEMRASLEATILSIKESFRTQSEVTAQLRQVASGVSQTMSSINSASQGIKDAQLQLGNVSKLMAQQLTEVSNSSHAQEQVWARIHVSMEQYGNVFGRVQGTASSLLDEIANHLERHMQVTKEGYEKIVRIADQHIADATQKLGATVSELDEYLQDLIEALEKNKLQR